MEKKTKKRLLGVGISTAIALAFPPAAPLMVAKELLKLGADATLGDDADKPGVKVIRKVLTTDITPDFDD